MGRRPSDIQRPLYGDGGKFPWIFSKLSYYVVKSVWLPKKYVGQWRLGRWDSYGVRTDYWSYLVGLSGQIKHQSYKNWRPRPTYLGVHRPPCRQSDRSALAEALVGRCRRAWQHRSYHRRSPSTSACVINQSSPCTLASRQIFAANHKNTAQLLGQTDGRTDTARQWRPRYAVI